MSVRYSTGLGWPVSVINLCRQEASVISIRQKEEATVVFCTHGSITPKHSYLDPGENSVTPSEPVSNEKMALPVSPGSEASESLTRLCRCQQYTLTQEVTHFTHSASDRMAADPSVEETVLCPPLQNRVAPEVKGLPSTHKTLSSSLCTRQGWEGGEKKKGKLKGRIRSMLLGCSWGQLSLCDSAYLSFTSNHISCRPVLFPCPSLKVLLDWGFWSYRQRQWASLEEGTKSKAH